MSAFVDDVKREIQRRVCLYLVLSFLWSCPVLEIYVIAYQMISNVALFCLVYFLVLSGPVIYVIAYQVMGDINALFCLVVCGSVLSWKLMD